jgi:helicase
LSAQERQVLERGFSLSKFEVCFATSTLAAGVNYPFQTIVFPKLTYQWGDRAGVHLGISEYRNMSGRAGRLGLHPCGFVVLLPKNAVEREHARKLVSPINQRLKSGLLSLSLRKTVLSLVASNLANSLSDINEFFQNTLYWYQTLDRNPKKLASLDTGSAEAVKWLVENELITEDEGTLRITALGKATAMSGLLPDTAVDFAKMLKFIGPTVKQLFDEYADGFIYACCECQEFRAKKPSRFLPYVGPDSVGALNFWQSRKLPVKLDRSDMKLAQCAQAAALYAQGEAERKIAYATGLSAGALHRLSLDVAWVMEGMHRIAVVPEVDCPQTLTNRIAMLARQVRWGVPTSALDILRVAERDHVPGIGRQRAMALVNSGLTTLHDVVSAGSKKLLDILRNSLRVEALIESVTKTIGHNPNSMEKAHIRIAAAFGIESEVADCYSKLGTDYETAILSLLASIPGLATTALDDGSRQNVPDILLKCGDLEALIECKTTTKNPALIKKEEAWAIVQKAADFAAHARRVTLGKPHFDEVSQRKAAVATDITLVDNGTFVEGVLRIHTGQMNPAQFMTWLITPGVTEIERLPGKPTYSL